MEVLADVLKALRLRGTVYFRATFRSPWGMEIPKGKFANFHIVAQGSCWVETGTEKKPVHLKEGDTVVFPRGHRHSLMDQPETKTVAASELMGESCGRGDLVGKEFGGDGPEATTLICGHFEYETSFPHPLIETLPPFLHLPVQGSGGDGDWLITASQLVSSLSTENDPGSHAIVDRLAEALFIQVLRGYLKNMDDPQSFLAAVHDAGIGRALERMHADLSRDWSLALLAEIAAMSKSVFADRFHRMVGIPPMVYLAKWRLIKARELLSETDMKIFDIAERVGYQSEASFSKAFKKFFNINPGAVRKMPQVHQ